MMIIYAVAERISYFCLAWNLIQPLGSKHIFTQSGWLMLFIRIIFPGSTNWGKPAKHSLPQNFFVLDRRNDCPLSWIAAAAPPWEKPTNSWTPCVYSLRPRVLSWIWIRWIQYATHRNNLKSPPALAMSTAMKIPLQQPATSSLGNIFWMYSRFSRTTRTTNSWMTTSFLFLTSKHDFCHTYGDISHLHIQLCLNLTMHVFSQAFSC